MINSQKAFEEIALTPYQGAEHDLHIWNQAWSKAIEFAAKVCGQVSKSNERIVAEPNYEKIESAQECAEEIRKQGAVTKLLRLVMCWFGYHGDRKKYPSLGFYQKCKHCERYFV